MATTNLQKALNLLGTMNSVELRALNTEVCRILKAERAIKNAKVAALIRVGSKVSFFVPKRGYNIEGTVVKVNRTTATVVSDMVRWKVSLPLLKVVA